MTPELVTQAILGFVVLVLLATGIVDARERRFRRQIDRAFNERMDAFGKLRELDLKRLDELDRRLREQELRP